MLIPFFIGYNISLSKNLFTTFYYIYVQINLVDMILVFGGTTEGKIVASLLNKAGKKFFYSTKRNIPCDELENVEHLHGVMDVENMHVFCKENSIKLIVDAAHPFAEKLHDTISTVSETLHLPVLRYERQYHEREDDMLWFDSFDEAMEYMERTKVKKLLAFTGVNTISKLKPFWENNECWVRIINSDISREEARSTGFPEDKLLYFSAENQDERLLLNKIQPDCILTKESGVSGYFERKVEAAHEYGIEILVIKRPLLSDNFIQIDNEKDLEKKIRDIHPSFLPLRSGFTTGACATAATKAALRTLITQVAQNKSDIVLPSGRRVSFQIEAVDYTKEWATASVRKVAGDDPDVTNDALIGVKVSFNDSGKISFVKGDGVGTVTLSGLDIPVGGPAVNPVPRLMIKEVVKELTYIYEDNRGVDISVFVPGGEILAKRTLNEKLGIIGGISIIGTSGIVKPFSKAAFVSSIEKEIEVAKANNCEHIVINSGARSEKYLRTRYESLPDLNFVHFGNFIGETLKKIKKENIKKVTLGIMLGKAVKLAEGHLDTHSKHVLMNKKYICTMADECGYGESHKEQIHLLSMARELTKIFPFTQKEPFYSVLADRCMSVCKTVLSDCEFELLLIDKDGHILEYKINFAS